MLGFHGIYLFKETLDIFYFIIFYYLCVFFQIFCNEIFRCTTPVVSSVKKVKHRQNSNLD